MIVYPFYDIAISYDIGDIFHYGNADYKAIKPIHAGDKLVIYDENINHDGNVILFIRKENNMKAKVTIIDDNHNPIAN